MLNWAAYKENIEGDVNHRADKTYWFSASQFTGLNTADFSRIMYSYSWMVTYYGLNGITKEYTIRDLVEGFQSDTTEAFNAMGSNDTLKGNLMLDPTVTPIYNYENGPTANRIYALFSGRGKDVNGTDTTHIGDIGSIRSLDNGDN
jgi:hypothetical protein